jgi:hypothetical protein
MPFGIVLLLINVGLIVHAAKTGRFWPWGYIILFIPGFGALAYVLVELVPEWFGSVRGQKARRHVVNTLDPSKRYRALTEQLESPTPSPIAQRSPRSVLNWGNSPKPSITTSAFSRFRWATIRSMRSAGRARSSAAATRRKRSRRSTICASAGRITNPPVRGLDPAANILRNPHGMGTSLMSRDWETGDF